MKRTDNTIKNIISGVGGQIILIFAQFLCRTVFIKMLGAEYLGLNGLFSNILNILSLSEMGFGTAILYSLYKPIEEKDYEKIRELLQLYKKIYIIISAVILVVGGALTPFIEYFIKDTPDVENLKLIYVLYLLNTVFSYVCVYKRSMIEADQKSYVINIYQKGIGFLQNLLQIVVLVITHNYIAYMVVWLCATLFTNLIISKQADKMYSFITVKPEKKLSKQELGEISKNTYALFLHRIGSVVVNGTDNLITSAFVGLVSVGIYSNYTLITTNLNTLVSLIFNSTTASVGNLGVSGEKEHLKDVFNKLFYLAFLIYGFCSVALVALFNPFIKIWVGTSYCFPIITVLLIVVNFYLNGTRILMRIYRDAFGLFWYFRYKSVFEALINLAASLILVRFWGINGVLAGTTLSTLLVAFWIEPYVLYKYVFDEGPFEYFKNYFKYIFIIIITGIIVYFLVGLVPETLIGFVIKTFIVLIFTIAGFSLFTIKSKYFNYYLQLAIEKAKNIRSIFK